MKRLMGIFLISILFFLQGCDGVKEESGNRELPNVVFIVIDTLRADHLPFYGYKENTTPFLSDLASRGVLFMNTFSASSWTAPATASIFTSLYPFQHKVVMNMLATLNFNERNPDLKIKLNRIPDEVETLAEIFKKSGFSTYGFADNINIGKKEGFDQGFDELHTYNYLNGDHLNSMVLEHFDKIKSSKRYFLYLQYMDAHQPNHFFKEWLKDRKRKNIERSDNERMRLGKKLINETLKYDGEINFVDSKIRELFNRFKWDSNTLLIVTADHGEELYDHGRWGHGYTLYNEVIKVPLLFYFNDGGFRRGSYSNNISTIDIVPTLRDFLGMGKDENNAGISLLPVLTGKKMENPENRYLFSHLYKRVSSKKRNFIHEIHSVINGKYVFIRDSGGVNSPPRVEFFNIENDRMQRENLYKKNIKRANKFRSEFLKFLKSCKKFKRKSSIYRSNKKEMEKLKTLGYFQNN